MTPQTEEPVPRETGSSSVRVAIVLFLGTLVLLLVMGVVWLLVRVEAPVSARVQGAVPLSIVVPRQQGCLGQRGVLVVDHDGRSIVG